MAKGREAASAACKLPKNWLAAGSNTSESTKIFAAEVGVRMGKPVIVGDTIKVGFSWLLISVSKRSRALDVDSESPIDELMMR